MSHAHSLREEVANALTHGLGVVAALCGSSVLITLAAIHGDIWKLGSVIVYGVTLVLLYVASTLYHAVPHAKAKARLKVFDHCAIYLLIAGSAWHDSCCARRLSSTCATRRRSVRSSSRNARRWSSWPRPG